MTFYLFIILILTFSVYLAENQYFDKIFKTTTEKSIQMTLIITCLLSILILSLRNINVADDTYVYYQFFEHPYVGFAEIGFYCLAKVIRFFTINFNVFLFFCALLSVAPFYYIVSKLKGEKWIYIFLYHVFLLYIFNFAIIRQTIAMSFVFLALYTKSINDKNNMYKIILFFLVATFFHRISIIFIPLFLMDYLLKNKKIILSTIILFICFIILKDAILSFVFTYLFPDKIYYLNEQTGISDFGIIPFLVFSCSEIAMIFFQKNGLSIYRKANYFFIFITVFMFWFPTYGRILQFGYLNSVFLLGDLYNTDIKYNKFLKYLFVVICFAFYVFMLMRNPYHVIPYYIF